MRQGNYRRGRDNGSAKLYEVDIPQIRKRVANGETLTKVASDYNVTRKTIRRIRDRERWAHVP